MNPVGRPDGRRVEITANARSIDRQYNLIAFNLLHADAQRRRVLVAVRRRHRATVSDSMIHRTVHVVREGLCAAMRGLAHIPVW